MGQYQTLNASGGDIFTKLNLQFIFFWFQKIL